jgi:hypothetical protein
LRIASRTICWESLSCIEKAAYRRESKASRTAMPASTTPSTQRCTATTAGVGKPAGDRAGGEDEDEVARGADHYLQQPEHQALGQHAAASGIDELRKQCQIEHRQLRIQQAGDEAHAEEPPWRVLR